MSNFGYNYWNYSARRYANIMEAQIQCEICNRVYFGFEAFIRHYETHLVVEQIRGIMDRRRRASSTTIAAAGAGRGRGRRANNNNNNNNINHHNYNLDFVFQPNAFSPFPTPPLNTNSALQVLQVPMGMRHLFSPPPFFRHFGPSQLALGMAPPPPPPPPPPPQVLAPAEVIDLVSSDGEDHEDSNV